MTQDTAQRPPDAAELRVIVADAFDEAERWPVEDHDFYSNREKHAENLITALRLAGYRLVSAAPAAEGLTEYGQCGSLDWTVEKWGRVTHKHACPNRTEPWCQTHPEWCQVAYAAAPPPAALDVGILELALDYHTMHRASWHDDPGGCNLPDCGERIAGEYERIRLAGEDEPTGDLALAAVPPPAAAPHKFERGWLFCRLCGLPQERHAQEDSK